MQKAILAAAAAAALFAPAVAQQINMNGQSQTGPEPQAQTMPVQGSSQAMAVRPISPSLLNAHQIRDIQQALEARGAHPIRTDGQWGPDIEAAIRSFQKTENLISQSGELDPLTLMALGLNPLSFGLSGASETTGQAAREAVAPAGRAQDQQDPVREQRMHGGEQNQ